MRRALVVSSDAEHAGALATALRTTGQEAEVLGADALASALLRDGAAVVLLDLAALHDAPGLVRRVRESSRGEGAWVLGVVDPEALAPGLRSALEARVDDFVVWPGEDAQLAARLRLAQQRSGAPPARREERFPETFHALVERLPVWVGVVALDGRLLYVNPEAARALGYERGEQLLGERADLLVPQGERGEVALRAALLAGGERLGARERQLLHRSGRRLDVELFTFPLRFGGQDVLVSVGRDLTEQRAQQVRLLVQERLGSVGTLAAGIAHQINNPLAYLKSNLTFLSEQLSPQRSGPAAPEQEVQEALRDAQHGAERVARIVRDLSIFSPAHPEQQGPVQLREVLEMALQLAGNELRHRARVVCAFGDVPPVWGNAGRLGQVFYNLLVNAAQALPEGKVDQHRVQLGLRSESQGWVVASVRDNGAGIAPEHMERLFTPFFTTRPAGRGVGLGLFICHNLVKEVGGQLRVDSALGQGSTFEVLLPCTPAPEAPPPAPPEAARPEPRARVLLVDDDPRVGRAFERLLRPYHDVTFFERARPALEWLRTGAPVDVLFCDLMLPDMGGLELYTAIAEARPELLPRVVVVTGGAFGPQARAFLDAMSRRRLDKPFERDQVLALIRQVRAQPYQM